MARIEKISITEEIHFSTFEPLYSCWFSVDGQRVHFWSLKRTRMEVGDEEWERSLVENAELAVREKGRTDG